MSTQLHTETAETVKYAHALFILNIDGHTPLVWDAVEEATEIVKEAERKFNDHLARGGSAYTTTKEGHESRIARTFDPLAERTILRPHMVGG